MIIDEDETRERITWNDFLIKHPIPKCDIRSISGEEPIKDRKNIRGIIIDDPIKSDRLVEKTTWYDKLRDPICKSTIIILSSTGKAKFKEIYDI